ncbi:MAG: SusC/RagA family TonB-linked outer membrane protein [Bacteroidetes bacterium]|nr:MAG: SusC/RagA family TonB-linked outer membrane protein [Bacteroidota bacterium]PTM10279.1 MAG: SusC/RagA family TonB-linked outer membrane protein [Bacteroidota bacterium]
MQKPYTLHRLLPVLCFLLVSLVLPAQNLSFTVTGKVLDADDTPLIGVTVLLPSLGTGTITDIDGSYSLNAKAATAGTYSLQYSYVGYSTVNRTVDVANDGQQFNLDITLGSDVLRMDEVVVVGSSVTSSRRSLGNAITSVKAEQLTNANPQGVLNSLQGRVAGAQIVQNSGDPAGGFSVRLRGSSSILGSSDPLYIVDGVVISAATANVTNTNVAGGAAQPGTNRIADLNPNDIESVEIINGAAAAAIYGSRASNGVVLITTKKGKSGAPQFTLSSGFNVNELRKRVPINLLGEQFGSATQRLYPIAGTSATGGLTVGANFSSDKVPVTRYDYQDQIFDTGLGTDQHLAVKGGNETSNYYAAMNYTLNEGIVRGTDFRRYGARLRYNQSVSDWMNFSVGINYNNSYSNEKPDGNVFWSPVNAINITNNIYDITQRDELGNLQAAEPTRINPLSVIEDMDINQEVNRAIVDLKVSLFPFEGFNITYLAGADTYNQLGNTFIRPYPYAGVNPSFFNDGYAASASNQVFQMNHDINAAYTTAISSSLTSTTQAGFSSQFAKNQFVRADGRALAPFVETVNGAATPFAPFSSIARLQIWGYYLQQTFSLNDRLFLTLAGRFDGASSFSPDNRNQFFPKVSASYLVSDEAFWQDGGLGKAVSTLRLRASWGQAGNLTAIGPYDRFNNYTTGNLAGELTINASNTLANPDVKPERQTELEIGADLSFLKDRIGLSATYYKQDIEDLLVNRVLSASQGGKAITTNVGNMENKGLEIALTASPVRSRKLNWDLFANFSRNRNRVYNLGQTLIGIPNVTGAPLFLVEDEPTGVFYGTYQAMNPDGTMLLTPGGLRQQERGDVATNTPQRGADGQPSGSVLRKVIGDPNPDYVLGFGSDLKIGNFGFGFLFESVQGVDVFDADKRTRQGVGIGEFSEQELNGELPRGWIWSIYPIEEWRISDGSFTKLREVTLSYTFPKLFEGALSNTVLTVGGRNLFSIDNFTSFDPEVNAGGQSNLMRGVNFGQVPIPRVYTVTLKTNF